MGQGCRDAGRRHPTHGQALTTDRLAGTVLAAFALFALWESAKLPFGTVRDPGPGTVPVLLALTLLVCSVAVVGGGSGAPSILAVPWTEWRHAVAILGTCGFMALALERLGYRLTIFVALMSLLAFLEKKSWLVAGGFALGFALGTHYLFSTILRVPMPQGPFGL